MAAGSPLGNFWREVATAEWLANVGLPLFVTVGAIVAAAVALRVQLGHDRELQRAARRAAAAHELGVLVTELVEEFRERPLTDEWWSARRWPAAKEFGAAVARARLVIDQRSAFGHVDRAGRELGAVWSACWQAAQFLRPPAEPAAVAAGMRATTAPAVRALTEVGRTLLRWDGHYPLVVPMAAELAAGPVGDEFERHVRERERQLASPEVRPRRRRPSRRAGS